MNTYRIFCLVGLLLVPQYINAQSHDAFSTAGGTASTTSFSIQYTVGEPISGIVASSNSFQLSTGFYPPDAGADLAPPAINPTGLPISIAEQTALTIETTVTDPGSGVASVTLSFRKGGDTGYTDIEMTNVSGDLYSATIDQDNITSQGADFFISANDNSGNPGRTPAELASEPSYPVLVQIQAPGLGAQLQQGQQQSAYRLISAPLNLNNKSSSNVLAELGSYDDTKWRFWSLKNNYFDFEGEAQFTELRGGANFDPGAAFFLLSAEGGMMQTGEAVTISTTAPFTKTLHRGWNFIGNPYNFTIPLSAVSLDNGLAPNLQSFTGGWSAQSSLQPFQGYIIDAGMTEDNVTLTINPNLTAGKNDNKLQDIDSQNDELTLSEIEWAIQIDAHSGDFFDTNNQIGVSQGASREWDRLDRPEPPQFADFLSLYFSHEEWSDVHRRYESDIRPDLLDGEIWDFEVVTNSNLPVSLNFSGISNVPDQYEIQLVDVLAGITQDLRTHNKYTLISNGAGTNSVRQPRTLQLVVGKSDYIEDQIELLELNPDQIELDQNYPNPFNPTTSIRYGIQKDAVVSLRVYNLLGQVVSTVVDQEFKTAGYHIVHWDAHLDDGSEAASGVYVYQLQVSSGEFTNSTNQGSSLTRKMLLVK